MLVISRQFFEYRNRVTSICVYTV